MNSRRLGGSQSFLSFSISCLIVFVVSSGAVVSQDIVDGFTRGSGNTDVAISLLSESYDRFYVGEGIPFPSNEISHTRGGLKAAYNITDWFALSAGGYMTFSGENVGKAIGFGGGLIFQLDEIPW